MAPRPPSIKGEYIETETGNKISRRSQVLGAKHIILLGKCVIQENVVIRGDLVRPAETTSASTSSSTKDTSDKKPSAPNSVHLGRYVFISPGCTLTPPSKLSAPREPGGERQMVYYPLKISDHVFIGANTHVRAAEIRSNVWIGRECVIGNLVTIREGVRVLDGTVLPANSNWASGVVVAGNPGRVVGETGEGWGSVVAGVGVGGDEVVGVRSRERWAAVGNKR